MKKPFGFVQDWGTFPDQTLVVIGVKSKNDIIEIARKVGGHKKLLEKLKDMGEPPLECAGFFEYLGDGCGSILYMKTYKDDWTFWGTLMHELHHAVFYTLQRHRSMDAEKEALAYAQQDLFQNIRRKLQFPQKDRVTL